MDNYGAFCPDEECANNRDGTCALRQAALLGMASWSLYPLGAGTFMAPLGPAAVLLSEDDEASRRDREEHDMYQNCSHKRGLRD